MPSSVISSPSPSDHPVTSMTNHAVPRGMALARKARERGARPSQRGAAT